MSASILSEHQQGSFVCRAIHAEGQSLQHLKRFGICVSRPIEVLRGGEPMILLASGSQFAVSRRLAECVVVTPHSHSEDEAAAE